MKFSKHYIKICRKLPARNEKDWQVGDWAYLEYDKTVMILVDSSDKYVFRWKNETAFVNIDKSFPVIWLPHHESQWLQMEDWPKLLIPWVLQPVLSMNTGTVFFSILSPFSKPDPEVITSDSDPLLACAHAWLKAVEI